MRPSLTKYAWLSIGAATLTIGIKFVAYLATGSVGLLSDAMEGIINFAAALVVLIALKIVERPPDEGHQYGHDKAEYFSSGIEGALIIIAALAILFTAIQRLLNPQPLEQIGLGLFLALIASGINLFVGQLLIRTGKHYESITLEADGRHLMSDVWTSVGVVLGVTVAGLTGLAWMDPIIAILVGVKIGWEGVQLSRRTVHGLMDPAISSEERGLVEFILNEHCQGGLKWHALRTRQSGSRRFISVHILVPGQWTNQEAHDLAEHVESDIRGEIPLCSVFTHVEPLEDPRAFEDHSLNQSDVRFVPESQFDLSSTNGSFQF
ncbi:MAG: cation diffusion facilitator family transporter [Chloroflexi bacterium]|jgi:cation diffusion facilitator family transporter|nr:cation diffusion facilitator family transporter [Chloroflexota bacterium]